jgi:hypothetical protein
MKTTRYYNQPTKAERRAAALRDAIDYLEPAQWRVLKRFAVNLHWSKLTLHERKGSFSFILIGLEMAGVNGLPASTLARHLITKYSK